MARIGFILVLVVAASHSHATTIIALRTANEIVIAADSMASGGKDFGTKIEACKIVVAANTVFASAGFMRNLPLRIDIHDIVRETFSSKHTVHENADQFEKRFLTEMGRVVRWAKENSPEDWNEYARNSCLETLFAGFENGKPLLLVRRYDCLLDFQNRPFVVPGERRSCPGDCRRPDGIRYEPLGTGRAVAPPQTFFDEHPDPITAARLLVAEQIAAHPDRVGGRINVVRVKDGAVECVDCAASCRDEPEKRNTSRGREWMSVRGS